MKDWKKQRQQIIGLGDNSSRKSYYPELQRKISDLEQFKIILDQISDAVFIADIFDGKIRYTNHTGSTILISRSQEGNIMNIIPELVQIKQQLDFDQEQRLRKSFPIDGIQVPFELSVDRHKIDGVECFFIVGRNIESQLQHERELIASRNNFELIFNSVYDAIFIHDANGTIVDVNDAMLQMYGLTDRAQACRFSVEDYSAPENDFSSLGRYWEKVLDGEAQLFEWAAIQPLTSLTFDVEVALKAIDYEGKAMIVAVVRNISERKKIERKLRENERLLKAQNEKYHSINKELLGSYERIQQINTQLEDAKIKAEESDKLKSAFLANMSHEIRTPLNAIMGFSQLIASDMVLPENKEKYSKIILQRGEDLLKIISDILDISKIEAGRIEFFNEKIDLAAEIEDLYQEYYENPFNKNKFEKVRFSHSVQIPDDKKYVIADWPRVRQVLVNFIDNALKFTDEGEIYLTVFWQGAGEFMFSVRDSGCGIPEALQGEVFAQFKQGFDKSEKQIGGTGLGLAISKALVEMMGGKIWFESEEGIGSTFNFSILFEEVQLQP